MGAGQFAIFARQMYPTCWKFAVEGYEDATSVPYGYLLVDLKPDQDERCRLRTCVFPGELQHVYVRKNIMAPLLHRAAINNTRRKCSL